MKKSLAFLLVLFGIVLIQSLPVKAWGAEVGYDGGFFLMSDDKDFKFKFNFQMQPQYSYVKKMAELDTNSFTINRMRTIFSGTAFSPKYSYYLSIEYSDEAGSVNIRDGQIDLGLADFLTITVGQFNLPINREDQYSGIGGQLVDGSVTYGHFMIGRDIGVQLSGNIVKPLTYYAFVTNGDGRNKPNRNQEMLVGSRLEYVPFGELSGTQGDLAWSENPGFGIGSTVAYDFGSASESPNQDIFTNQGVNPLSVKLWRGEADGEFRWMGYSIFGEYLFVYNSLFRTIDHGILGQTGYFIIPKKFEIAARYSATYPSVPLPALTTSPLFKESGGNAVPIYETVGGLNYYFRGHQMKFQTDYSLIVNRGGFRHLNDQMIRAQLTMVF